jgi:tryptophan synthase alpha chain
VIELSPPVLSIYLMAGEELPDLAAAAVAGGARLLEIGVPFSDPLADGPTIQRAGQRALEAGMTTARALELVAGVHARLGVPLVPMTYAGPVLALGEEAFCRAAAAAGAGGLIVPDVPSDEAGELRAACAGHGLDLVPLLAPTSTDARIAAACELAGGFVYLVSVAGVTGARTRLSDRVEGLIERVRAHTRLPLLVGFGIAEPDHVRQALAAGADGVIIGSRAIEVAEADGAAGLERFVRSMAEAMA